MIEVEALPDLPEGEPATEPALELAPEEEPARSGRGAVRGRARARGRRLRRRALHLDHRSARLVRGRGRRLVDGDDEQRSDRRVRGERGANRRPRAAIPGARRAGGRRSGARGAREWRRRDGGGRRRAGRVRRAGIAVGGRAPGLARARRGAGGLRRPRHPPDGRGRDRRRVAARDARRLARAVIGPGLERVCLAAFVPLHDAEQRGHAGVSAASSDLPDLRPVEARPQFDPSTALVIADLQNDFADPAGSLAVVGSRSGDPRRERRGGRGRRGGRRSSP